LSINLVFGLQVENVVFYTYGEPISAVSYNPVVSTMGFKVTGENLTRIIVDLSDINYNPKYRFYKNYPVPIENCDYNETSKEYTCFAENIMLWLNKGTAHITFKLEDNTGTMTENTIENNFEIDNTKPTVEFIGTNTCKGDVCYIPSRKITDLKIKLLDSKATFEKGLIFFQMSKSRVVYTVDDCEGLECVKTIRVTCESGEEIKVSLAGMNRIPSQDDAGNAITEGMIENNLICDSEPPEKLSITIMSGSTGFEVIKVGDTMSVIVDVYDDTSTPKVEVNFSGVGGGKTEKECLKNGDNWRCEFSTNVDGTEPYVAELKFTLKDFAGNEEKITETIQIYGADEDITPDNWVIESIQQSPKKVNKDNLVFPRKIFVNLDLKPQPGKESSEIIDVEENSFECKGILGDDSDIKDPNILYFSQDKIYLTAEMAQMAGHRYENLTKAKYNCSVNILTKRGDFVNTIYETQDFFIEIDFDAIKSMSQRIREEIVKAEVNIQKDRDWISKLQDTFGKIYFGCQIVTGIKGLSEATGVAETATAGLAAVPSLSYVPFSLGQVSSATGVLGDNVAVQKFVLPICEAFTCTADWQMWLSNLMGQIPGVDFAAKLAGYNDVKQAFNPYNSKAMAIASFCLPAIIVHRQTSMAIECNYARCLSEGTGYMGSSPSQCKADKHYAECVHTLGGIFSIIPFYSLIRDLGNTIKGIFSDPVTFLTTAGVSVGCKLLPGITPIEHAVKGTCNALAGITSITRVWSIIGDMIDPRGLVDPGIDNYCEQVITAIDPRTQYWQGMSTQPDLVDFQQDIKNDAGAVIGTCKDGMCTFNDASGMKGLSFSAEVGATGRGTTNDGNIYSNDVYIFYDDGSGGAEYKGTASEINKEFNDISKSIIIADYLASRPSTNLDTGEIIPPQIPAGTSGDELAQTLFFDSTSLEIASGTTGADSTDSSTGSGTPSSVVINVDKEDEYGWYADLGLFKNGKPNFEKAKVVRENGYEEATRTQSKLIRDFAKEYPDLSTSMIAYADAQDAYYNGKADRDTDISTKSGKIVDIESQIAEGDNTIWIYEDGEPELYTEEQAKERLKKLNKDIKTLEKQDKKLKQDMDKGMANLKTDANYELLWTGFGAWQSMLGIGKTMGLMKDLFGLKRGEDSHFMPWLTNLLNEANKAIDKVAFPETQICQGKYDKNADQSSFTMIKEGTLSYTSASYITATRSQRMATDSGYSYYDYFISGGVYNAKKDGLKFKVLLFTPRKDLTSEVRGFENGAVTLLQGEKVTFSGSGMLRYNSTQVYNKVCIEFLNNDLYNYFDRIELENGNRLCQTIVVEG